MQKWWIFLLLFLPYSIEAQIIISIDSTSIYSPGGLVFDNHKNLFLTSVLGYKVQKIDTNGLVTTIAGTGSTGFFGDGGPATSALLNQPAGITIDTIGNIFFADAGNQRIRRIDKMTGIISTIAGIGPGGLGTGGYSGDSGLATAAALNDPLGVCFDKFGNLYISDNHNGRIRKISTSGVITTIFGNGYGSTGDGGSATAAKCQPGWSILFDNYGNFYFTQSSSYKTIRKINAMGVISTIVGDSIYYVYNGDNIPASNAHLDPQCIAVAPNGLLYISDGYNNRVRKVDSLGIIHTIAGNGASAHGGDGGASTAGEINQPGGLIFDNCGNLYIGEIGGPAYIRKVSFNPTCNLSVSQVETNNEVTIYPNPASEEITISGVKTDVKWGLFNIKSIIEQQGILKRGSNTLSIEALSPGLYILELTMDDGTRIMKKIIKL